MDSYRVLAVTNLWPYAGDPSYGCFVKAQMDSLRPLGVDYDLMFINGRETRWNYLRAYPEFWRQVRRNRYDLIHAHMTLSALVARWEISLPLVISFMGHDTSGVSGASDRIPLTGYFYRFSSYVLARLASAVIVKTEDLKQHLKLDSAIVIPNGVDMDLFKPVDQAVARQSLGLDPRKKFVLFPYDPLNARKRFDVVQAAVAHARKTVPELEVLPVFAIPQSQMPTYMNAADVMVLASQSEGSPNAVKEAMAVNLPVVSVEVGDTVELIGKTEGCFLVKRDPEEIAARVVEVCRRGTRTEGRKDIQRLSMQNIAARIVQVYSDVVHRK